MASALIGFEVVRVVDLIPDDIIVMSDPDEDDMMREFWVEGWKGTRVLLVEVSTGEEKRLRLRWSSKVYRILIDEDWAG